MQARTRCTAALLAALACALAAGPAAAEEPAHARTPPVLRTFVEAEYPEEEAARGATATVGLAITVGSDGAVTAVDVVTSAGTAFDAAAVSAARRFVFDPAVVDGAPRAAKITYRYAFAMEPRAPARDEEPAPPRASEPPPTTPSAARAIVPAEEVTVRRVRAPASAGSTVVATEEGRRVPGAQGDALKVAESLPGVGRPPLGSASLVVWGAAPRETRTYVDGVEIPALFHGSALRSTVNGDLVSSIAVVPGAYGADYGRALGGVVRVETRDLRDLEKRGARGYVAADTLDASAMTAASFGDRVHVGAAARASYLDRLVRAVSSRDVGDVFPIPRYGDALLKASIDLRPRETLDATVLGSRDDLSRTLAASDPAEARRESTSSSFWRAYVRYTHDDDDGAHVEATPFVGEDRSSVRLDFGATPAGLDVTSTRYGLRASYRAPVTDRGSLTLGVDASGTASTLARQGSLTLPAREGDAHVFGQPPGDDVNADAWSTHILSAAPYASFDARLGPLTVSPGVRLETFLVETSRATPRVGATPSIGLSRAQGFLDPRISVRWDASHRIAVTGSAGIYHQAPDAEDLSAVFGTPELGASTATHLALGQTLRVTRSLSLETIAFYKSLRDLPVRSRLPAPLLARALVQDGEGRGYGLQLLLRQQLWRGALGWVAYTLSRSDRRYIGTEVWRRMDFDQPHVLSVVVSQTVGRFTFGARFRYASGMPRTPVTGAYYDARQDRFAPVLGAPSSTRLPPFDELDLRVEHVSALGPRVKLSLYAEVLNALARENAEEIAYSRDYTQRAYVRGLPTLAVIGARLDF